MWKDQQVNLNRKSLICEKAQHGGGIFQLKPASQSHQKLLENTKFNMGEDSRSLM